MKTNVWARLMTQSAVFILAAPFLWAQGSGKALSFDGIDDHVNCGASTTLEIAQNISVETWVKTTQSAGYKQIVCKNKMGASSFSYYLSLNNLKPAVYLGGTAPAGWQEAATAIPSGRWTHIAFTYNGSQLMIYINGVLDRQVAVSGSINTNPGQPVWIGNRNDYLQYPYQGELDEVRIWSKVLTTSEIRSAMCRKLAGTEAGLAAYYRLDEGNGTWTEDLSPNSNDGTLVNGPAWTTSGAAIGDESTYVYGSSTLNLAHADGDDLTVNVTSGSPYGMHIYRVNSAPNVTAPPVGYLELDPLRYWGVFVAGGTSPTYTVTYDYDGHPGIPDENTLKLAKRANNSALPWGDSGATLDTGANTLAAAGQTGTEYILGSTIVQFCNNILLLGHRVGADAVFEWNSDCSSTRYEVFRADDINDLIPERWIQNLAWATVDVRTFTDFAPPENLVYYDVLAVNAAVLTLDWTGEAADDCGGFPCDEDGFLADGFSPLKGNDLILPPYADGVPDLALSGDPAEFRVKLTCPDCSGPGDITYIDLLLDINDDGSFSNAEVLPLAEVNAGEEITTGKRYGVQLPALLAVDADGDIRYAKADGNDTLHYTFRASNGTQVAGGPAAGDSTLTLWNNGFELVHLLGIPVVEQGNCSYDTNWATALTYFEEAETLLAPPSPYNQYMPQLQHPDYLSAMMASTIAETAYTLRNYDTLFQSNPAKLYRDVMLDWITFADEQTARLDAIALNAPSAPNPAAWKLDFPKFCIFNEQGTAPFAATQSLASLTGSGLPGMESALPLGLVPAPDRLAKAQLGQGLRAPEPVYIFGDNADAVAEWDRSDAYLLKALSLSIHAAAVGYRIYEDPAASPVLVSDLNWIETALTPEDDAKAHAKCDPEPCPPLNGLDDDGDGLADDLGFAARVVEMFPGLGIYTPDGALTLETAADDSSAIIDALREGMRLVLLETDNQVGAVPGNYADATLVYGLGYGLPPSFEDNWRYTDGAGVADGLPDLVYAGDDLLPVAWCPDDDIDHAPPMDIQGGLGDDIQWWIDQAIEFYNEYSGQPPLLPECYPQAWGYTVFACDWGWQWQKAVRVVDPVCFNFRDDIERLLTENDITPADLGPDAQTVLEFMECIDVRQFIDDPEDVRDYLPFTCTDNGFPPLTNTAPACDAAGTYSFNGFLGDWDEPMDPIIPNKFWTIEPFSAFNQDANGILQDPGTCTPAVPYDPDRDCVCDPSRLSTDTDCILPNWDDVNGNGQFDLFERILMNPATNEPVVYIDLNNDGQWNGWTDQDHQKQLYAGEYAEPGEGMYNAIYIYWQDPTFGGRLDGMSNEGINNLIGAVAGWADGTLEYPFDNHHPVITGWDEIPCGLDYCFQVEASDPDPADTVHFKLIVPADVTIQEDYSADATHRYYRLTFSGTRGLIVLVYDNVNNLKDISGQYEVVTR